MPNDLPLLPPNNQRKYLDKSMISLPSNFRHLAHVGEGDMLEIGNLRDSGTDDIKRVNEMPSYLKPSSSHSSIQSQDKQRIGLDDEFPCVFQANGEKEHIRGYSNQPSSHQYINVARPKPSKKNYPAPVPPPQSCKPNLVIDTKSSASEIPDVVFRTVTKKSNPSVEIISSEIHTPKRIEAPKANSVIIQRPDDIGGVICLGLDDFIPVTKNSSPMRTPSPLHQPVLFPKTETPILIPANPPKYQEANNMPTVRSTSAQGTRILNELEDWLDDLDDSDRDQLSTISTDESGYPTLTLEKDRAFMKHLVLKYELGMEPETINLRKKKVPAPMLPSEAFPIPTEPQECIPPLWVSHVSMPPDRLPPSYDAPSFDAPVYKPPATTSHNGVALPRQNALDLRYSDDNVTSPVIADFMHNKAVTSTTIPISLGKISPSSSYADVSSPLPMSEAVSSISSNGEESSMNVLTKGSEINANFVPVPKPRTRKMVATEPLFEESVAEEMKNENVMEEFEVIETVKMKLEDNAIKPLLKEDNEKKQIDKDGEKIEDDGRDIVVPDCRTDNKSWNSGSDVQIDDDDEITVTRF